jgi:hypothetical protein
MQVYVDIRQRSKSEGVHLAAADSLDIFMAKPYSSQLVPTVVIDMGMEDESLIRLTKLKYYNPKEIINVFRMHRPFTDVLCAGPHHIAPRSKKTGRFFYNEFIRPSWDQHNGWDLAPYEAQPFFKPPAPIQGPACWAKNFHAHYGVTPTLVSRAVNKEMGTLFNYQPWFSRFGYRKGKISSERCDLLYWNQSLLRRLEFDRLENLAPLALFTGMDPKGMRHYFGKSLWRQLSANSMSRNLLIADAFISPAYGGVQAAFYAAQNLAEFRHVIRKALAIPSRYLHVWRYSDLCMNDPAWFDGVAILTALNMPARFRKDGHRIDEHGGEGVLLTTLHGIARMAARVDYRVPVRSDVEFYERLHTELQEIVDKKQHRDDLIPGAKYSGLHQLSDGRSIVVRELHTGREIATEGREMHHCVAAYADRCYSRNYRVLTARWMTANGEKRLATIGVRMIRQKDVFVCPLPQKFMHSIDQVQGVCNGHLTDETGTQIPRDSTINQEIQRLFNEIVANDLP